MMKMVLLLLLALSAGFAQAEGLSYKVDPWRTEDTQREVAYAIVHLMDWGQTRNIAKHPERWYEKNPKLGRHPSVAQVDRHFLFGFPLGAISHPIISYLLPAKYRPVWQYITIGYEWSYVERNFSLGITIDLP